MALKVSVLVVESQGRCLVMNSSCTFKKWVLTKGLGCGALSSEETSIVLQGPWLLIGFGS